MTPLENTDPLDALLSGARRLTPADQGAAERFLAWQRGPQAPPTAQALPIAQAPPTAPRRRWPALLAALASAAAIGGLTVTLLTRAPATAALPSSAAYDSYSALLDGDWAGDWATPAARTP